MLPWCRLHMFVLILEPRTIALPQAAIGRKLNYVSVKVRVKVAAVASEFFSQLNRYELPFSIRKRIRVIPFPRNASRTLRLGAPPTQDAECRYWATFSSWPLAHVPAKACPALDAGWTPVRRQGLPNF